MEYIIIMLISTLLPFVVFYLILSNPLKIGKNKVHFYITRDKIGNLILWLGKPQRNTYFWGCNTHSCILEIGVHISNFGLNSEDFKNLKWEDEPKEVFLNLED